MARSATAKPAKAAAIPATKPTKVAKTTSSRAAKATTEKEPKAKRGKKKAKTGPKRALSAYMFFSKAMRKTVQEENPEVSFGQIGKILGDKWKNLSDAAKAPYNAEAEKDKVRYANEKASHVEASDNSD
ncbi:Non-histone chromosomal protein 6 [Coemansia sp. RSA 455]|nr:Non-histone chromosomal protein 6 [Coemansia sp. S680]KAJ2038966.1 Non-histone chromosomal protein 6 [Coemansia sp. S3946]KAJ2042572.1 Non-histone chromosomal protein 6 [Coemansia sp. S16]KAJ2052650.1 Non-histone chromosomal protein 6 [Coemansia sp. S2]KAJ2072797.1 Non-histone chromosomal protein 6 [Coemansia sp. S142-1]KAJ2075721.1 Non-histone chromosomal protein 6 [Coemansia sp. S155-1]KAJ2100126.1 Non-histone chromosomal protein 6 [Coemansia sp. S100]KAJ2113622.1 Non-histone chromosoma